MAYIQCKSGGGAETPTLLWTNPNPNSNFAAQTVSIDLSKYESIIIETFTCTYYPGLYTLIYNRTKGQSESFLLGVVRSTHIADWRNMTIDDSGITFGAGMAGPSTSNSSSAAPQRIWGLKKSFN